MAVDWEKMICRILLLISLNSCVSGTFEVNVTQTSYQAEENHNITLEWMFTTKPDSSSTSLNIYCEMFTDHNDPVLYHVHEGVEAPESQDEQFAGRVQSDKDALREGRIRLHVSRLRTEDSGLYICDVKTDDGVSSDRCLLNVTAAVDQPEPQKPTERPQPESRVRISLYVGLTAARLAVCAGLCFVFRLSSNAGGREHAVEHELDKISAAV
ncbi:V-set and immunoglobulin domain-containing protein 1-like [Scomber scombrus]|uniref:V-set and immunoglobulin domain-containing protein 1-like n=1 Tax=Scomber scombrus TaxID=13677 RepID=UPI002DD81F24|nr:V-set and immunoglobulin domain-containing protein 1-like [Scomber scombrus]